ncbi:STM4014 family protein [Streptomyces sp. NBC_00094]|uniref:STM4014 family protein n=1 Tax=Streptomyces sp. NBC_00094 TaxID=2903620 RepID=UPI0022586368|nr:STM4014 family protein [Streptomyces sp. NBC_00094]MCX5394317.1 STM4014 family protein [Streptomyces sp. NBC_00094]
MTVRPRLVVVGDPAGRRVAFFQDALRTAGLPGARVVSWPDVLRGRARFAAGETVRIDSPGEDPEADRLLRGVDDPARVEGSGRWYARFTTAVGGLAETAGEAGATLVNDPAELAVLFDKRLSHGRLRAAGVPVPESPTSGPTAPAVAGWADIRALLDVPGLRRVFVKLAHGSSASGVLAVETNGAGRIQATTSVERRPDGRLFNSLRVRRYTTEHEIAAIVDALAPDGLHVERWLPKATQGGRAADLRVVVIDGRATHAVVRTSRSPMTNLHLGGARGDLTAARAAIAAAGGRWEDALDVCERAAAAFPGTRCVGVDLLPATGWRRFAVGEVNAFGDLLPCLTGLPGSGAESLDTYAAQVAAQYPATVTRPASPTRPTSASSRTTGTSTT